MHACFQAYYVSKPFDVTCHYFESLCYCANGKPCSPPLRAQDSHSDLLLGIREPDIPGCCTVCERLKQFSILLLLSIDFVYSQQMCVRAVADSQRFDFVDCSKRKSTTREAR